MFRKIALLGLALFSSVGLSAAQDDAMENLRVGLEGLKQAGKDPALMAQLMRDMQDPELMKEAQKMMNDPKFKAEMKKMQNSKEFKESLQATQDMMSDPAKAAAAEAKMEHMLKVGQEQMKKAAEGSLDDAMNAMLNNKDVMNGMADMVKDPNFKKQFDAMMKDPSFREYMNSMAEMMQDPAKKAKFEKAAAGLKAAL